LGDHNYSTSVTVSGWEIGTPMSPERAELGTIEVEAGKMYYIEIAGSNYVDLTADWKKENGVPIADETHFEDEELTEFK